MSKHRYDYRRQPIDPRDWRYAPPRRVLRGSPDALALTGLGPVLDQGDEGSCGANAAASMIMFDEGIQGLGVVPPSRQLIYWNTRILQGDTGEDAGVNNRSMLTALNTGGYVPESEWDYTPAHLFAAPPAGVLADGTKCLVTNYAAVSQDQASMEGTIAARRPFLFGFTVYESFEADAVDASGDVPMPGPGEKVLGGHDVMIYGYNRSRQVYLFKNSYGTTWGRAGMGTIPYAYAHDPQRAGDFWVINAVPAGPPAPPAPPAPSAGYLFALQFGSAVAKGQRVQFPAPVPIPAGTYGLVPEPAALPRAVRKARSRRVK